jgi:hypothetical protein
MVHILRIISWICIIGQYMLLYINIFENMHGISWIFYQFLLFIIAIICLISAVKEDEQKFNEDNYV